MAQSIKTAFCYCLESIKGTPLCVVKGSAVVQPAGFRSVGTLVLEVSTSHKPGDAGIIEVAITTRVLVVGPSTCEGSASTEGNPDAGINEVGPFTPV